MNHHSEHHTVVGDVLYRYVYTCHKDNSAVQGQQNVILKGMPLTGDDQQPQWTHLANVHKELENRLKEQHQWNRCSVHKLCAIVLESNTPQLSSSNSVYEFYTPSPTNDST